MKYKNSILIFVLALIFSVQFAYAQDSGEFTKNKDVYLTELTGFFQKIENKDERKKSLDALDEFAKLWESGNISENVKDHVYKTSFLMLKKKLKPYPHFCQFIYTMSGCFAKIEDSESGQSNPENFLKSIDWLINSPKNKHLLSYLETMDGIFRHNILNQTTTTRWITDKSYSKILFDSVPKLIFLDLTLSCFANNDSSVIFKTSGIYYPLELKWKGAGGKINWKRAGFQEDTVYAKFNKYEIITKNNRYTADSAAFYDLYYFRKPLSGRISEKILADVNEDRASYPRFDSYDKHLEIKSIFKDIDFSGGFSLYGNKILGKGDKTQNANLTFKRHKKLGQISGQIPTNSKQKQGDSTYVFIIVGSKAFTIHKDRVVAEQASVTIYNGSDSIYHPGLRMKYIKKGRELSLLRYEEGVAQSPYFDTYHKIDLYFEAFNWKMDENKINFEMIRGPGASSEARFQSFNYFSLDKYYQIQGIDEVNPLYELKEYAVKNKTKEFFLDEYARFIKKAENTTKALLLTLSNMGFLIYNLDDDKVIIKDRLFYYLSAKQKKTDYDVIEFNSLISGNNSNATLNLDDFSMTIRGVDRVLLSDSQKVYIYPEGKELILKSNRDFYFNGRVHAGLFDFFGKKFAFDYDNFKLDLPSVDSLTFMVKSFKKDENGKTKLVRVKSIIEGISGNLEVDNPKNKSGLKHYPNFPVLNSKNDSYVYYNKKSIQNGAYAKDKFNYKIYSFTIDSLDDFQTEHLIFKGMLNSGGIFPDLEEPLKVQPDYSLGFVKTSPDNGYPVYGGKGTFSNLVNLSNKGLRGDGTLNYVASTSKSNDFLFLPDSMKAVAQNYELKEQTGNIEYPDVIGQDVGILWKPASDIMKITSIDKQISMYKDRSKLTGTLYLTPEQLKGRGIMDFQNAEIESKVFKYKNTVFDADSADFRLKSYDLKEMAFVTHNYKSHIDFVNRKGNFISNGGGSKVEFPVNQYICFMDEFEWSMDNDELALSDSKNRSAKLDNLSMKELIDIDLTGSKFISINPAQDSLQFFSPKAKYSLKENIIHAQGVKIIKVADAAIFPSKGEVTVLKKAEMQPLEHATIIANTTTEYHNIYDALVNILSRKKYNGNGKYDYIDENEKKQQIIFDRVGVDSTIQTYASGYLQPEMKFMLSDAFEFTGDAKLLASREYLTFKGAVHIKNECSNRSDTDSIPDAATTEPITTEPITTDSATTAAKTAQATNNGFWMRCNIEVNPKEIYIPVPEIPTDKSKRPLFAGLYLSSDTSGVYSCFLEKRLSDKDSTLFKSFGFLVYDKESGEYRISSKEKLKTPALPGKYLSLSNSKCIVKVEGEIKFATDFGRVEFNAYGNAKHYIIPDSTLFDLSISSDFFFNDKSLDIMTNSIKQNAALKPADISSEKFTKALYEILGVKEADKLISEMNLGMGLKKIPNELKKTLFLSDVKMKWVPEIKSFVSKGKIGIANLNKEQVNKYVNGYIVIKKRKNGDELTIYLEPEKTEWYIFDYDCRKKLMSGYSTSKDFNAAITTTKPDNRKLKSKGEKDSYSYYITTDRRRSEFLDMIQNLKY